MTRERALHYFRRGRCREQPAPAKAQGKDGYGHNQEASSSRIESWDIGIEDTRHSPYTLSKTRDFQQFGSETNSVCFYLFRPLPGVFEAKLRESNLGPSLLQQFSALSSGMCRAGY